MKRKLRKQKKFYLLISLLMVLTLMASIVQGTLAEPEYPEITDTDPGQSTQDSGGEAAKGGELPNTGEAKESGETFDPEEAAEGGETIDPGEGVEGGETLDPGEGVEGGETLDPEEAEDGDDDTSAPEEKPDSLAEANSSEEPCGISGFLWTDSSGDPGTDGDGLYNGDEQPLVDYTVYLYGADDLSADIADAQTDGDGVYRFEDLAPGAYILGIGSSMVGGSTYLPPNEMTADCKFAMDWESDPPMAYTEVILLEAGQMAEGMDAGLTVMMKGPSRAPAPKNVYVIDVNNIDGSLTATGNGYSYTSGILAFNAAAAGNEYIIKKTLSSGGLSGITFTAGSSPASVTVEGIMVGGAITLPADFSADLEFNKVQIGSALTLPTGYKANLGINGLTVPSLTLPSDYDQPITFNGITASGSINYPVGYNEPITIAGSFDVAGTQFPAGYTGPVTFGGGVFDINNAICRPGTALVYPAKGIFLPNTISAVTFHNAVTGGGGSLSMILKPSDDFELFLTGSSVIDGYIEVPAGAALTIDSADDPGVGSESGSLSIRTSTDKATIGGGTGDSGLITIKGGTVEATQACKLGSTFHPAAIGGGAGHTGNVVITGGKVIAKANADGAAIGGGSGAAGVGNVTITGGTVLATAGTYGAAIGGGNGANGGLTGTTGATILITGGTVVAEGGYLDNIILGNSLGYGAAIGSGKGGFADVTITGGHVTANSAQGAGIGNGATDTITGVGTIKGSVAITGGIIRGYTLTAGNIGKGFNNGYAPEYRIDIEADILMYGRGNRDVPFGVQCFGNNQGDGYFVSIYFDEAIRGDLYVYDASDTSTLVRVIPINLSDVYMSVLFSTGHDYPEQFRIFVDYYDYSKYYGMRQIIHHWDHNPAGTMLTVKDNIIPSVTHMGSYPHNFHNAFVNTLYVNMDDGTGAPVSYRITERYVDMDGNPIANNKGKEFNEVIIPMNGDYNGTAEIIAGYHYLGYKWDSPPSGSCTPGNPSYLNVTANKTVYLVYKINPGVTNVTVSKVVTGHFIDRAKSFEFTVYFTDGGGSELSPGTEFSYTGGTVPGQGAKAPADGALILDAAGKDTFSLKHGQTITIINVPADARIRIVETPDDDYDPSYTDSAGSDGGNDTGFSAAGINGEPERAFDFINAQKSDPVPSGIIDDLQDSVMFPLISVLLLLTGWLGAGFIRKKLYSLK